MTLRGAVLAVAAALAVAAPAAAAPARGLQLGFLDVVAADPDAAVRDAWLERMRGIDASRIRLRASWASIATRAPRPGENPSDPDWPGYDWSALDAAVAAARAHGLAPLINFGGAPAWARQGTPPPDIRPTAWKPRPRPFGAFAAALARRYRGQVRHWQVLNEPNLDTYLAPQWERGRPFAPRRYRALLNAAYAAIKGVDRRNVVVTAGTAPFGDPGRDGRRMRPVRFWRELLCLRGRRALRPVRCPSPARFDVLAHHSYSVRGPHSPAFHPDDVTVADFSKLRRPLARALRTGRALPRRRKPLWVTEISWDSRPPDPQGVPAREHARWLAQALHTLWRQGVSTILWFQARDSAPAPSFSETYQSGVFFRDGRPKLAARAFAFPFVVERRRGGRGAVAVWGKAPAPRARVAIQRRARGAWRTVRRLRATPTAIFTARLRARPGARLRATAAGRHSLPMRIPRR